MKLKIVALLLCFMLALGFTACTNDPVYYTVAFDSQGGGLVDSQSIESGKNATKPSNPTYDGYTFKGWSKKSSILDEFLFTTVITSDITIYAIWEKDDVFYSVTFNSNGGNTVDAQTIISGGFVERPQNPTKAGFVFVGWSSDQNEYEVFLFTLNAVIDDTTLYAFWAVEGSAAAAYAAARNKTAQEEVVVISIEMSGGEVKLLFENGILAKAYIDMLTEGFEAWLEGEHMYMHICLDLSSGELVNPDTAIPGSYIEMYISGKMSDLLTSISNDGSMVEDIPFDFGGVLSFKLEDILTSFPAGLDATFDGGDIVFSEDGYDEKGDPVTVNYRIEIEDELLSTIWEDSTAIEFSYTMSLAFPTKPNVIWLPLSLFF